MTRLTRPLGLALAALALAACGGGSKTLYIGGGISGYTTSGLVLINKDNNDTFAVPAGSQSFAMPKLISNDEHFDIEVQTQPTGATCDLLNNKGTAGAYSVSSVSVVCKPILHTLTGTISGLTGTGLILINGSDKQTITTNGPFAMAKVGETFPYAVLVYQQPSGQTCTVTNGVGTVGTTDISNLLVNCQ
ncbi:MAG: hypothetical protein ACXU8N_02060 [Telluria sp.]